MKKLLLLVIAIALSCPSFAQSADKIVKKHIEAVGGEAAWSKVASLKFSGSIVFGAMAMNDVATSGSKTILNGKGMRNDFSVQGKKGYYILTPTGSWFLFPGQKLQLFPEQYAKQYAADLYVTDELMTISRKQKISFAGKDSIDNKEVFRLIAIDTQDNIVSYYVDTTTYYLLRKVYTEINVQITENYSDFKRLPEGIVVPMTQGNDDERLTAKAVEVNTVKDESIFQP